MNTSAPKKKPSLYERMQNIDIRVVYLLVLIFISLSIKVPLGIPVEITKNTRILYDTIENLEPGSKILVGVELVQAQWPEWIPMTATVFDQIFQRGDLKVYMVGMRMTATPIMLIDMTFPLVDDGNFYGAEYGKDWVYLGYIPGGESAMARFGTSIRETISTDYWGTPIDELPIMEGVDKATDFDYYIAFGGTVILQWIRQFPGRYGIPMGVGTLAMNYPEYLNFIESGEVLGMLNGVRAAAEYELLLGKKNFTHATDYTDGLSLVYAMVLIMMIIGNIGYFLQKYSGGV